MLLLAIPYLREKGLNAVPVLGVGKEDEEKRKARISSNESVVPALGLEMTDEGVDCLCFLIVI